MVDGMPTGYRPYMGNLVQMGVDLVRWLIEVVPRLAEFRRFMSRLQEIATLPLDVVDDATPGEAAMQADGDEPRAAAP
jgi:hypothetical protein